MYCIQLKRVTVITRTYLPQICLIILPTSHVADLYAGTTMGYPIPARRTQLTHSDY